MAAYYLSLLILWLGESKLPMTRFIAARNMSGQNIHLTPPPARLTDAASQILLGSYEETLVYIERFGRKG